VISAEENKSFDQSLGNIFFALRPLSFIISILRSSSYFLVIVGATSDCDNSRSIGDLRLLRSASNCK
jgi:hypothetical protein